MKKMELIKEMRGDVKMELKQEVKVLSALAETILENTRVKRQREKNEQNLKNLKEGKI